MWVPDSFAAAFPLALLSLVCWGSWSNTAKEARLRGVPFAHFYTNWAFACFSTALLAWVALGGARVLRREPTEPDESPGVWRVLAALGAGLVFNVANALLILGINLAGLSVAFPMGIGTALVLGTVLTYLVDAANRPSQPVLLFSGVALGFLAVVTIAAADWFKRSSQQNSHPSPAESKSLLSGARRASVNSQEDEEAAAGSKPDGDVARVAPLTAATVCLFAGVLMSGWGPLSAYAQDDSEPGALNPYSTFVLYCFAVLLSSLKPSPLAIFLVWSGTLSGESHATFPADYYEMSLLHHSFGWVGGVLWSVGTLSNLVAGNTIGLALSYAVGQAAPMMATAWGIFWYREFDGAGRTAIGCLALMLLLYCGAIVLLTLSK